MPRAFSSYVLAMFCTVILTSCSAISALDSAGRPLEIVELRASASQIATRGRAPRDLIVELPSTGGALDTDRIMIRPSPLNAQYLPDVRWPDPTPAMLQTLILRSLENTQGLRYVGRRPIGQGGDVALVSELTDFQAEQTGPDAARINLRLIARLVREEDAQVVATRIFTARAEVPSLKTTALVQGFDLATGTLLSNLTGWAIETLGIGLRKTATVR